MSTLILHSQKSVCVSIWVAKLVHGLLSWDLGKGWVRGYGSCFHGFVVRLGPVVHGIK